MIDPISDRRVREQIEAHPPRPLFASLSGAPLGHVVELEAARWRPEVERLLVALEDAFEASRLPEAPSAAGDLEALLVRTRLEER